jgi:hypothetical protein
MRQQLLKAKSSHGRSAPHHKPVRRLVARAAKRKSPEVCTSGLLSDQSDERAGQRLRLLAFRSRAAACLRGAAVVFAEPLRADAEARFAAFATGLAALAGVRRFSAVRFSGLVAVALLAVFRGAVFVFTETSATTITFSGVFDGVAFVGLRTSLLVLTDTVWVETTDAAGAAEAAFVLPLGRPPFLANWASANILRKASWASAISWTCETRRSRSALSFSARYIASAVVASIVNVWKGSTISTGNMLNLVENAISDRGSYQHRRFPGLVFQPPETSTSAAACLIALRSLSKESIAVASATETHLASSTSWS